jgi:hypothetical protein
MAEGLLLLNNDNGSDDDDPKPILLLETAAAPPPTAAAAVEAVVAAAAARLELRLDAATIWGTNHEIGSLLVVVGSVALFTKNTPTDVKN